MSAAKPDRWDSAIVRAGTFAAYFVALVLGAMCASRLLTLRRAWTHHRYDSPRYFGFEGSWQRLEDAVVISIAGAFIGPSIVYLLLKTGSAICHRDWRRLRPSIWLVIVIPAWWVTIYLTYIANALPMTKDMFVPGR